MIVYKVKKEFFDSNCTYILLDNEGRMFVVVMCSEIGIVYIERRITHEPLGKIDRDKYDRL